MNIVDRHIGKIIIGFLVLILSGICYAIYTDVNRTKNYKENYYCPEKMEMIRLHGGGAIICAIMPKEK